MDTIKAKKETKNRKQSRETKTSKTKSVVAKETAARKTAPKKTSPLKAAAVPKKENFPWTMDVINHFIREHAYYIWQDEGRPEGRSFEIWIRSEKEVLDRIIKKTALKDLRK